MRIGTRGSALALTQARAVADALGGAEIVEIATTGDAGPPVPGSDKGRWVDTIEEALLDGRIDLAVHSAKDVPDDVAPGMQLRAALPREDPRDALVGADSLDALPAGARIGTSSLRRSAELLAFRDDLRIVELHGNVDTRLRKLGAGEIDALVLAAAGLRRLGREAEIGALLDPAVFVPAAGQGIVAVEGHEIPDALIDHQADIALRAERSLVHALGATCHTPVGVHFEDWTLRAFVGLPDGSTWLRDACHSPDPGPHLLARLETMGARELLLRAEEFAA